MPEFSKISFGSKDRIEVAKQTGKINEHDVILLDNGELAWIDENGQTVFNTPRSQQEHKLKHYAIGDLKVGDVLHPEMTIDDLIELIASIDFNKYINDRIGVMPEDVTIKEYIDTAVGQGGAGGVSPTIEVDAINGGYKLTITDSRETNTINLMHGSNGQTPRIGENGNWWIGAEDTGIKANGYTPVKGEDYFTEEEEAKMVEKVWDEAVGDLGATLDNIIVMQEELTLPIWSGGDY